MRLMRESYYSSCNISCCHSCRTSWFIDRLRRGGSSYSSVRPFSEDTHSIRSWHFPYLHNSNIQRSRISLRERRTLKHVSRYISRNRHNCWSNNRFIAFVHYSEDGDNIHHINTVWLGSHLFNPAKFSQNEE